MKFRKMILGLTSLFSVFYSGCGSDLAGRRVAVFVDQPRPYGWTDAKIAEDFHENAVEWSGLERQYLVVEPQRFGVVYLWRDGNDAQDYFDASWRDEAERRYDSEPRMRWFEVPATTPGAAADATTDRTVVAIVRVSPPWYAARFVIRSRMEDAVPDYRKITGLAYKYFTIAESGKIGGIYLWESRVAAEAFYDEGWHQRIRTTYGEDAIVEIYNAPAMNTLSID